MSFISCKIIPIFILFSFASGTSPSYGRCTTTSTTGNRLVLNCTGKGFSNIPKDLPENAGNYQILILDGNHISTIQGKAFEGFENLEELLIANNKISKIEEDAFQGIGKLDKLDLDKNELREVEGVFDNLPNLKSLFLSRNEISRIEEKAFESLNKLENLIFYGNSLHKIRRHDFLGLSNLRRLDLSLNRLRKIHVDAFNDLGSIRHMDFSYQNSKGVLYFTLSMFQHFIGKLPPSYSIDISNNFLKCTCQMSWLLHLMSQGKLPDGRTMPVLLRDEYIADVKCGSHDIQDKNFIASKLKACSKTPPVV